MWRNEGPLAKRGESCRKCRWFEEGIGEDWPTGVCSFEAKVPKPMRRGEWCEDYEMIHGFRENGYRHG